MAIFLTVFEVVIGKVLRKLEAKEIFKEFHLFKTRMDFVKKKNNE